MLTLPAALLVAAAPMTELPARFDRTRLLESQQALIQAYHQTREVTSGIYHWATHNVVLDRYLAQQMALDAARNVDAVERAFGAVPEHLSAEESRRVAREMSTARDLLAKASRLTRELRAEAGREAPSRTEFRLLSSELYGTIATAADLQGAIGSRLGLEASRPTGHRSR